MMGVFKVLVFRKSNKFNPYYYCYRNIKSDFLSVNFTTSSPELNERVQKDENKVIIKSPKCAADVLRNFGCTETHIEMIFTRHPPLRNAYVGPLESKLGLLGKLGVNSSDLVKMVNCRPRFLKSQINRNFEERIDDMLSLFRSKELLVRAIVRNPSLLMCDFHKTIKPVFALYEEMGISRSDLISMLLLRPTLISRTHMGPEKLDYIQRTGVPSNSKIYKYVVTIIGVSRLETVREKIVNLEKFGFSEDEVLKLFGRCPLMITLSVEKVQRNMTFVIGTMKLPAQIVCDYPFLLYSNLELLLRPRVLLGSKMRDMGLGPQMIGPLLFRALRMSEKRFLKVFVECQEEDYKMELLRYYGASKGMKRLAESSKKVLFTSGFPF